MYSIGEHVLYGLHGVCKIDAIEKKRFGDELHDYYILKPVFDQGSTIFVSTKKEALVSKMIPLLCRDDIYMLMDNLSISESYWIDNESVRKEEYKTIIESNDRAKQLSIFKAILLHRQKLIALKRKMHSCDEIILKNVEKRLYEEFAFVLETTKEDISAKLHAKIL